MEPFTKYLVFPDVNSTVSLSNYGQTKNYGIVLKDILLV